MQQEALYVKFPIECQIIPDFRFVNDSIELIAIHSSGLTSLQGPNLQNLTRVWLLDFGKNLIRFINPDIFKGTNNVKDLYLSDNLLTFIPPKLLDPMKKLRVFIAKFNNLLHVHNLFSVTRPLQIFLQHNNITDLRFAFDLKENQHQKINRTSICGETDENVEYEIASRISYLNLSFNLLTETSFPILPCYKNSLTNRTLILQIDHLRLTANNLQNLGLLLTSLQVQNLSIAKNQIQYLSDKDFKVYNNIVGLRLSENKIRIIDTGTFKSIRLHLRYLVLDRNLITSLNGSLRNLPNLTWLQLKYNYIQFFAMDEFVGLKKLSYIFLQHNHIKTVEQLRQLPRLHYLDIGYNDIETLLPDHLPKTLRLLKLAGNSVKLECSMLLYKTDITQYLSFGLGNNLYKESNCPRNCFCKCTEFRKRFFISIDCNSKNLSVVPEFLTNNITKVKIPYRQPYVMDKNINSTIHIEDNVLGIDLENNSLVSLELAHLPPNLIQLYLAYNNLERLPESILKDLKNVEQVTLSGNPWKCDCNAMQFKKWLTLKKTKVLDIDLVLCRITDKNKSYLKGRAIWNITDFDLCPEDILSRKGMNSSDNFGTLSKHEMNY